MSLLLLSAKEPAVRSARNSVTLNAGSVLRVFPDSAQEQQTRLYEATALTPEHSFTGEIEGPAVDRAGNVYAVAFAGKKSTIARVSPTGAAELFIDLPGGSFGNGIRFDRKGRMFVADYTNHNVLRIDPATKAIQTFHHNADMNQPNDLAITAKGDFYASDPDWKNGTGQLWWISRDGKRSRRVASGMGTTNGIDLSPDGKTLYVNESVQRKVWAFDVQSDGSLAGKRLLIEFPDFGFDGMRIDVDGNLYATRHGKGVVAVISPQRKVLREIPVLGAKPSNICFGGPDGRTAYVTEMEKGRLVQFRVERPGLEWTRWPGRRAK
jgi:sugar lactone lactonase YvrE